MTCKDVCVRQARSLHLHYWQISILKIAIRAVLTLYELRELFKTNATSKEDMYFFKFPGEVVIMEDKCARIDFLFSLDISSFSQLFITNTSMLKITFSYRFLTACKEFRI